jgi:hypothetical protein
MNHLSGTEHRPTMLSVGFIEELSETLVALAIAAAICVGVMSLAVHLNETQIARTSAANTAQAAAPSLPPIAAKDAASQFN